MPSSKDDLLTASKQRLMNALGVHQSTYMANIKQWFRQKWTKEEFDRESRKLLAIDQVHLHNQFFLALLNKIDPLNLQRTPNLVISQGANSINSSTVDSRNTTSQILPQQHHQHQQGQQSSRSSGSGLSSTKRRKRSSRPTSDRATFDAVDISDYLTDECPDNIRPTTGCNSPPHSMSPQRFCVQELFLPDTSLVMGRLLVGVWETGLTGADDRSSELIVLAVQTLLKNIITAILLKRKQCRVTGGGTFAYDIGFPMRNPTLRTTLTRLHADDAPVEIDRTIESTSVVVPEKRYDALFVSSCEDLEPRPTRRINLLELYKVLADRQIIPSHSVHAINVERISQMLH